MELQQSDSRDLKGKPSKDTILVFVKDSFLRDPTEEVDGISNPIAIQKGISMNFYLPLTEDILNSILMLDKKLLENVEDKDLLTHIMDYMQGPFFDKLKKKGRIFHLKENTPKTFLSLLKNITNSGDTVLMTTNMKGKFIRKSALFNLKPWTRRELFSENYRFMSSGATFLFAFPITNKAFAELLYKYAEFLKEQYNRIKKIEEETTNKGNEVLETLSQDISTDSQNLLKPPK